MTLRPAMRRETAIEYLQRIEERAFREKVPLKHRMRMEDWIAAQLDPKVDPIDPVARSVRRQARDMFLQKKAERAE